MTTLVMRILSQTPVSRVEHNTLLWLPIYLTRQGAHLTIGSCRNGGLRFVILATQAILRKLQYVKRLMKERE